jgi:hypothetical protein
MVSPRSDAVRVYVITANRARNHAMIIRMPGVRGKPVTLSRSSPWFSKYADAPRTQVAVRWTATTARCGIPDSNTFAECRTRPGDLADLTAWR